MPSAQAANQTLCPYEAEEVDEFNPGTAQLYYSSREIRLRDDRDEPKTTTYTAHYPPKRGPVLYDGELQVEPPPPPQGHVPFMGHTKYSEDYPPKSVPMTAVGLAKPDQAPVFSPFPLHTTYQAHFQRPALGANDPPAVVYPDPVEWPTEPAWKTSYADEFQKKQFPERPAKAGEKPETSEPFPTGWQTTYRRTHVPHPIPKHWQFKPADPPRVRQVFDDRTTYNHFHDKKEPWVSGVPARDFKGWRLPHPRPSLGVEFVGSKLCFQDRMYTFISRTQASPCTAKQIFTTVHDNQTELCVLIFAGESTVASQNTLLGQFTMFGIPPGPEGVPQLEITFNVREFEGGEILTVTAIDLDSGRQKEWLRSGGGCSIVDYSKSPAVSRPGSRHASRPVSRQ